MLVWTAFNLKRRLSIRVALYYVPGGQGSLVCSSLRSPWDVGHFFLRIQGVLGIRISRSIARQAVGGGPSRSAQVRRFSRCDKRSGTFVPSCQGFRSVLKVVMTLGALLPGAFSGSSCPSLLPCWWFWRCRPGTLLRFDLFGGVAHGSLWPPLPDWLLPLSNALRARTDRSRTYRALTVTKFSSVSRWSSGLDFLLARRPIAFYFYPFKTFALAISFTL